MRRIIAGIVIVFVMPVALAMAAAGKTSTRSKKGRKAVASRQSWRSRQVNPTPERYKEIQEALAKRGYLQGSPTGVWDQNSAEALRRFQQEQNLTPSGKLDALSLIALGLGPKYPNTGSATPSKPSQP